MPNRFWSLIDAALRTPTARPLFFLLFRKEIRAARKVMQTMAPSVKFKPRLYQAHSDEKHYPRRRQKIVVSDVVYRPISTAHFRPERRDVEADQFLVDAILAGGQSLKAFLSRQEANPGKPYWTTEYSRERIGQVKSLLEANPAEFVLTVFPDEKGRLIILDGHHRLRTAQVKGLNNVSAVFGVPGVPTIDWDNPRQVFLSRLVDKNTSLKSNRQ